MTQNETLTFGLAEESAEAKAIQDLLDKDLFAFFIAKFGSTEAVLFEPFAAIVARIGTTESAITDLIVPSDLFDVAGNALTQNEVYLELHRALRRLDPTGN